MILELGRSLVSVLSGGNALGGSIVRCVLEDTIIGHSGLKVIIFGGGFVCGALTTVLVVLVYGQRRSPSTTPILSSVIEHEGGKDCGSALQRRRVAPEDAPQTLLRADNVRADRGGAQGPQLNIRVVGANPNRGRVPGRNGARRGDSLQDPQ
eukprot:6478747-Amphidinium_carterae.1